MKQLLNKNTQEVKEWSGWYVRVRVLMASNQTVQMILFSSNAAETEQKVNHV